MFGIQLHPTIVSTLTPSKSHLLFWLPFLEILFPFFQSRPPKDNIYAARWLACAAIILVPANLLPIFQFGIRSLNFMTVIFDVLFLPLYFFCRSVESLAFLCATMAVVSSFSWVFITYYSLYSDEQATCEVLMLAGFNVNRSGPQTLHEHVCHTRSFANVSFACGTFWLAIAGCIFRSVELRRNAQWEELFRTKRSMDENNDVDGDAANNNTQSDQY